MLESCWLKSFFLSQKQGLCKMMGQDYGCTHTLWLWQGFSKGTMSELWMLFWLVLNDLLMALRQCEVTMYWFSFAHAVICSGGDLFSTLCFPWSWQAARPMATGSWSPIPMDALVLWGWECQGTQCLGTAKWAWGVSVASFPHCHTGRFSARPKMLQLQTREHFLC